MSYVYRLSDLAGNVRSELPAAKGKRFARALGSMGTSAAVVRLDHDDADFLLGGDALVRIDEVDDDFLRDGSKTLQGHHTLITAEEVVDEEGRGSVAATFADPYWVTLRRLCGKSAAGYSMGTALAPVDRGAIVTDLVNATNVESPTGLRMGTVTPSSNTYVSGWSYKRIGEAIVELGAALDGYDWTVRPIPFVADRGLGIIGELDVVGAAGTIRPNAAFESGPTEGSLGNVRGYRRAVTNEGRVNRVFHLAGGAQRVLTDQNAAAQAARGLLEDVVTADLTVDDLRLKLLAYHLAVRAGARQTITFSPVRAIGARVPRFGRDFNLGDVVPFRAAALKAPKPGAGPVLTKRINVNVRVYGVEVNVDELGAGTPTLTVVPQ